MSKIDSPLAELVALTAHIKAMHEQMAERGFTMAGDTRIRLQSADALIAEAEGMDRRSSEATAWVERATDAATMLRAEAAPQA